MNRATGDRVWDARTGIACLRSSSMSMAALLQEHVGAQGRAQRETEAPAGPLPSSPRAHQAPDGSEGRSALFFRACLFLFIEVQCRGLWKQLHPMCQGQFLEAHAKDRLSRCANPVSIQSGTARPDDRSVPLLRTGLAGPIGVSLTRGRNHCEMGASLYLTAVFRRSGERRCPMLLSAIECAVTKTSPDVPC